VCSKMNIYSNISMKVIIVKVFSIAFINLCASPFCVIFV